MELRQIPTHPPKLFAINDNTVSVRGHISAAASPNFVDNLSDLAPISAL